MQKMCYAYLEFHHMELAFPSRAAKLKHTSDGASARLSSHSGHLLKYQELGMFSMNHVKLLKHLWLRLIGFCEFPCLAIQPIKNTS